jgi:hypothetical protein
VENSETARSVADFAAQNRITATALRVAHNPQRWTPAGHNHWRVTLAYAGRAMVTWLSFDPIMVERKLNGQWVREFPQCRPETDLEWMLWRGRQYREAEPGVDEALRHVRRNASAATRAGSLDGWLAGCGYEGDPRANRETYLACLRQADELYLLLGSALYRELLSLEQ